MRLSLGTARPGLKRRGAPWTLAALIFTLALALSSFTTVAQNTSTVRYQTVADMVAFPVTAGNVNLRLTALVTGRVTTNDGGGGVFFFSPANATATNLGTVFPSTGVAGRWLREYSGPLNVRWFGALGDNVSDDTDSIQNAITQLVDTGGTVFFPSGTYKITSSLTFTGGVTSTVIGMTLLGDGQGPGSAGYGTRLSYQGASNSDIAILDTGVKSFVHNRVENLLLDGNDLAGYGLLLAATTPLNLNKFWTFQNVGFRQFTRTGVLIGDPSWETATPKDSDAHLNVFNNCWWGRAPYGVVINVGGNCYQTTFNDCAADANIVNGINFVRVLSGHETIIRNCFISTLSNTVSTAMVDLRAGSLLIDGAKTEEARLVYRPTTKDWEDKNIYIANVDVNDNDNLPGSLDKVFVYDAVDDANVYVYLLNCKPWRVDESKSRDVIVNSSLTSINVQLGPTGTYTLAHPERAFISTGLTNYIGPNSAFAGSVTSGDNVVISVAGKGLQIKEGSNARMGATALVNGTVTVSNTSITANTRVFLSRQVAAGTTAGTPSLGTVVVATSFVINSLTDAAAVSADDDSTIAWMLVEPSP